MSENWIVQYSLKDGQPMLNVRADSVTAFFETLAEVAKGYQEIALATSILTTRKPEPARPAAPPSSSPSMAPSTPQQVPAASYVSPPGAAEVGPVLIKSVSKSSLKLDGTPMKSPKYTVEFANGKKLSTFDAGVGQSAETLSGQSVYYSTKTNGQYTNLAEVRRAS